MSVPQFIRDRGDAVVGNGFARALSGNPFAYKSFHPLAERSLRIRPGTGEPPIAWQTGLAPHRAARTRFVWIAAYAGGTAEKNHTYTFCVNGDSLTTFEIKAREKPGSWATNAKGGLILSFSPEWVDWQGDVFGYMWLDIPSGPVKPDQPVDLKIMGDDRTSRDWFAVFQYKFERSVSVVAHPVITLDQGVRKQVIGVYVDHVDVPADLSVQVSTGERMQRELQFGYNVLTIPTPLVGRETEESVTVQFGDASPISKSVLLRPPVQRTIFLIPHSHNDIGYSDHQDEVLKKQFRNIEDALALIRRTEGYPEGARFKWNTEILWPVEKWLEQATPQARAEFVKAVREKKMGLDALYGNMLTGICRPEELLHTTDYAVEFAEEFGVQIHSAMSGDIPGFIWALVPALAERGVKYFSSGPNYQPFLPDTGDRVGHSNRAWCDRPFYWVSPSGKEEILFWMAGKGYSWFHDWILGRARPEIAHHIYGYMGELDDMGYPYEIVQLRYTTGADNGPTDPGLPDFVAWWNERHASPHIVIATTAEMFEEFEKRYADRVPRYSGELTPYWEDGVLSTLRELGAVREASQRIVQAEALVAMIRPEEYDSKAFSSAWKNITLFYEHTWGAYNSVTDPDTAFAVGQWEVKRGIANAGVTRSWELLQSADRMRGDSTMPGEVDIVNTTSWSRTEAVLVPADWCRGYAGVCTLDGIPVPAQPMAGGGIAFIARDVPPYGSARYKLTPRGVPRSGTAWADTNSIGSDLVGVRVDPRTGCITSLLDRVSGMELVDASEGGGFNEYFYVPGRDPGKSVGAGRTTIKIINSGPIVATMRTESEAPGCRRLVREMSVVSGSPLVLIVNLLDRELVREKESIHFGFPFAVPGGGVRFDGGIAFLRPELDQLAGACKDYFYAQRWADVSNDKFGCTLVTVETPIIEIGEMTSELQSNNGFRSWRTTVPRSTRLFSYVMNNYWHTNYKADQEGEASVRYALLPHGRFDHAGAHRTGVSVSQPLVVLPARGGTPVASVLNVDAAGESGVSPEGTFPIVATGLSPARDRSSLILRLFNASGTTARCELRWTGRVYRTDPAERRGERVSTTLELGPLETRVLRLEREE